MTVLPEGLVHEDGLPMMFLRLERFLGRKGILNGSVICGMGNRSGGHGHCGEPPYSNSGKDDAGHSATSVDPLRTVDDKCLT